MNRTSSSVATIVIGRCILRRDGIPTELVLDLDATDDPLHGEAPGGGCWLLFLTGRPAAPAIAVIIL